jgi:uncharacterized SAM-binding protein YcdF (DUF218 family)
VVVYLKQMLLFFAMPLGIGGVIVLAGVVLRRRYLCVVGVVVIWVCAMPVTGNWFIRVVEEWTVRTPAESMPQADAIVVLSGGRVTAPGDSVVSEWQDADRFFGGIELYQAGKAPMLIYTDGWSPRYPQAPSQGQAYARFARAYGVPDAALHTTEKVVNTAAEARAVAELISVRKDGDCPRRILLVTSAYHMRRAKLLFARAGIKVVGFPVDFQVSVGGEMTVRDFVPQAECLEDVEKGLKEVYGWFWSYRGMP